MRGGGVAKSAGLSAVGTGEVGRAGPGGVAAVARATRCGGRGRMASLCSCCFGEGSAFASIDGWLACSESRIEAAGGTPRLALEALAWEQTLFPLCVNVHRIVLCPEFSFIFLLFVACYAMCQLLCL